MPRAHGATYIYGLKDDVILINKWKGDFWIALYVKLECIFSPVVTCWNSEASNMHPSLGITTFPGRYTHIALATACRKIVQGYS